MIGNCVPMLEPEQIRPIPKRGDINGSGSSNLLRRLWLGNMPQRECGGTVLILSVSARVNIEESISVTTLHTVSRFVIGLLG